MGQSPPSSTYNMDGDGIPFFQGKVDFGQLSPTPRVWTRHIGKIAEAGDILLSVRAPVGPTNVASERSCIGRGLAAIRPRQGINKKYLLYVLRLFAGELDAHGTGTTFKAISGGTLRGFPIPVAPSPEQERIADALDELFSDLDAGVAALERTRERLKLYRASLLNSLVPFTTIQNASDWKLVPLKDLAETLDQGWSPKCDQISSPDNETWGVIKTTAIQPSRFLAEHNKKLPVSLVPRQHLELRVGDVLITRAGPRSRVGVTCLIRQTRPRLMLCDKAYRLRPNTKLISGEFLEFLLNTPRIQSRLEQLKTGINDSGVNLTQRGIGELFMPVPSIPVQEKILKDVSEKLSAVEYLSAIIDDVRGKSSAMRSSILHSAFEGRLVPHILSDKVASELVEHLHGEIMTTGNG